MKIAQISTPWVRTPPIKYGGTEQVIYYLTKHLVELGHDVTLFATGNSETQGDLWSWYEQPTYTFQLIDEVLHTVKAVEYISTSHAKFDIIHNHTYTLGPALLSLSKLRDLPSVTTYHSHRSEKKMHYFRAFSQDHRYISISQSQQNTMPELNWVANVSNAIEVDEFPFQAQKGEYLLFLGTIAPWKGAHIAIQVAETLHQPLKMAGPIRQPYFEQEVKPHLNGHLIEYLGEADFLQKIALYQHAAALLVPIQWEEPFGLVMIEALACGTPIIAFRKGSTPEIIEDGTVGFLVNTVEEMCAAVSNITHISPEACRTHVERHFNARLMAERYVQVYKNILEIS